MGSLILAAEEAAALSPWLLLVALAMVVLSAFFVASEFALIASRRERLESRADNGDRRVSRSLEAMGDLQQQLAGAQLGITVSSIVIGLIGEPIVAQLVEQAIEGVVSIPASVLHVVSVAVALTMVVFVHMVFGEMVPKNLTIADPEKALLALAPFSLAIVKFFRPLIWALNAMSVVIVKAMGLEPATEIGTALTAQEFSRLVDASHEEGHLVEFEHALLSGALDFGERHVSAVMVPRSEVVSVSRSMSVAEIEKVVVDSGHSRLLVAGNDLDEVVGVVHAKDMLRLPVEAQNSPLPLEMVRKVLLVSHDQRLEEVLLQMRHARQHFAAVGGPAGRTLGVVTLEDVLEELVGEIEDETDIDA
ncbi:MAG: hemolysin family protein [Acidimicrobiales bacterium]